MATKIGTDGQTAILDLSPPDGMMQQAWDSALTAHQASLDARNLQSMRFCGGLAAPYSLTPDDQEQSRSRIPMVGSDDGN